MEIIERLVCMLHAEGQHSKKHLERISNHVEILEGMGMIIGEYPVLAQKDEE